MRRRKPIPILTEAQREAIRRGWKMPGEYYPGECEREHRFRIEQRAEAAGVEINAREVLTAIEPRPPGFTGRVTRRWKRW